MNTPNPTTATRHATGHTNNTNTQRIHANKPRAVLIWTVGGAELARGATYDEAIRSLFDSYGFPACALNIQPYTPASRRGDRVWAEVTEEEALTLATPEYLFMTSAPHNYSSSYRRLAVVQLTRGFPGRPEMISTRAEGVQSILLDEVHCVGSTKRSYGYRRMRYVQEIVNRLNAGEITPEEIS